MAKNHSDRAHALLSASGAKRWLNCTPSPRLSEQFKNEESSYAAEGTLAHELADTTLNHKLGNISKKDYLKQLRVIKTNQLYKLEMDRYVGQYVDYVMEQYNVADAAGFDPVIFVEQRFDLTNYVPEGFGTGDGTIVADSVLEIVDLKYGKGIKVDADDNPQLKLYGLGALDIHELSYDIKTVRLTIVQPRLNHISSWDISVEALKTWGLKVVKPKAEQAFKGEGEQCAGDWCRWCPAKAKCKALTDYHLDLAKMDFEEPKLLTDLELLEAYSKLDSFADWMKSVKNHVYDEAIKGKVWPGYKMVQGRSSRKWLDNDLVIDALLAAGYTEDDIQTVKVKGIGDISNLMSVDEFNNVLGHLVTKPPGKPTLVPESDKRQAFGLSSAKQDFDD